MGLSHAQAYGDYTTNVYGRTPFLCYTCTNNYDAANSRSKFYPFQASEDCGFNYAFNPNGQYVQKTPCYTYCMVSLTSDYSVGLFGQHRRLLGFCFAFCCFRKKKLASSARGSTLRGAVSRLVKSTTAVRACLTWSTESRAALATTATRFPDSRPTCSLCWRSCSWPRSRPKEDKTTPFHDSTSLLE